MRLKSPPDRNETTCKYANFRLCSSNSRVAKGVNGRRVS